MKEYYCNECGGKCGVIEETFDYSGAHCTHGRSGTHHTGIWVSACCFADYEETFDELEKPQSKERD